MIIVDDFEITSDTDEFIIFCDDDYTDDYDHETFTDNDFNPFYDN